MVSLFLFILFGIPWLPASWLYIVAVGMLAVYRGYNPTPANNTGDSCQHVGSSAAEPGRVAWWTDSPPCWPCADYRALDKLVAVFIVHSPCKMCS